MSYEQRNTIAFFRQKENHFHTSFNNLTIIIIQQLGRFHVVS